MQNVPMAIADGARAGVAVNVRLVEEGVLQPAVPTSLRAWLRGAGDGASRGLSGRRSRGASPATAC